MSLRTILHVIETGGPGGAEAVVAALVARGSRPTQRTLAAIPSLGGWLAGSLPASVKRIVSPSPADGSLVIDLPYLRALRRLVHLERPSLVHAHSFDTAVFAGLATLGTGIPFIATFHGAKDVRRYGFRNRIKWGIVGGARQLVCVSQSLAQLARSIPGVPGSRVGVVLNGVDFAPFSGTTNTALRVRLRLSASTTLIGALGNVRPPKGYHTLLEAMALLRERGVDAHLAIAGDDQGSLGDELRARRSSLNLDAHVTFLGFVQEPAAFLEGLDLFVLSSISEGFSLATVQAMAAARAIVATRSGGPEEILTARETGLLVPVESAISLADSLQLLTLDAARAAHLATAARTRALELFSVERMVGDYERLYEDCTRA